MKTKSSIKNYVLLTLLLAIVSALFVSAPKLAKADAGQWIEDGAGTRYIYDEAGDYYTNCWQFIDGNWFYFGEDGYIYTGGWAQVGSHWYYFWGGGAMGVGWIWDNYYGSWFYCDQDTGAMYQGCWAWIGNAWYGFWGNGQMCQGWIWDSSYNNYFYCDFWTGVMYQGCWAWIGDAWYGFWADGEMCYGWVWDGSYNDWFYCDWYSGYMYIGWHYINGSWYYFWGGGAMARSCWVDDWWLAEDGRGISEQDYDASVFYPQEVANLVNEERAKYGLAPLTFDSELSYVATVKAEDMAINNYFDHISPTYGSMLQMLETFGIEITGTGGENIAKGQMSPSKVMNDWMSSPGHRANILNPSYNRIGVGYRKYGNTTYWVQVFLQN